MKLFRLRRKIHISYLIGIGALALTSGVILAASLPSFGSLGWVIAGTGLCCLAFWRRTFITMPLIIIGGLLIGLWRGGIDQHQLTIYKNIHGHAVTISGVISEDTDINKAGERVLRLTHIHIDGRPLPGTVRVSLATPTTLERTDNVTVSGKLLPGFGSFAGTMYRAKLVSSTRPQPGDIGLHVRDWFAGLVRQAIPDPQASLGLGFLTGQRRALPEELMQSLQIAGLTHIIVASGYNLTILVRFARRGLERISKYLAAIIPASLIVSFIAITGFSPSMSRAGLVAGLCLAAWYYGRKFHPLVLLPFVAAITVLINPSYAWGDLGWQLSFAAFAGVMILAPLLQAYFFGNKKPGNIRQILGETIAAQIATLPILILAFGQFSNVALIANVLILPLVPLAMLLTFITGIGMLILPAVSWFFGLPTTWLLTYMTTIADYLAKLSWAQGEVHITPWMAASAYVVIISVCFYLKWATKVNLRDANLVE